MADELIFSDGSPAVPLSTLDQMVLMLRTMIGDLDEEDYTDSKLKKILGAASNMVTADIYKFNSYTVGEINGSTGEFTISPDLPASLMSLILMKAACLLSMAELRYNAAMSGFKAVCDKVSISSSESNAIWTTLTEKGFCQFYEDLRKKVEREHLANGDYFKAIISTFSRGNYGCQN